MITTKRLASTIGLLLLVRATLFAVGWAKTFGGLRDETASSVQQTVDSGYVVAGNSEDGAWLIRIDATSLVSWQKTYSAGSVRDVNQNADGSYIVAGTTSLGAGGNDMWVLKLDGSGNVEWEKSYGL